MTYLNILIMNGMLAVCRLDKSSEIPKWAISSNGFLSITRTTDELSIVCLEGAVPAEIKCERGFRGLKVLGPLDFSQTGILASLSKILAEAKISIFAISTFDTDYILVRDSDLELAANVLTTAGHTILYESPDSQQYHLTQR